MLVPLLIGMLLINDSAEAQLELLRKNRPVEQQPAAETPMVEIPEGLFTMGLDGIQALEDERPKHQVGLSTFFTDLHEVTTAQYAAFLAATTREIGRAHV